MKKIVILLISLVLIAGCSKPEKKEIKIKGIDELKEVIEKVDKVKAISITESGMDCYDITGSKTDLYMALIDMKIENEITNVTKNSTLKYVFLVDDQEYTFEFNNGNLVQNNKYYKVSMSNIKINYNTETTC